MLKKPIRHIGFFPFDTIIVNNNMEVTIPEKYHYTYVHDKENLADTITVLKKDLVDQAFPLYHDPHKLAKAIVEHIHTS